MARDGVSCDSLPCRSWISECASGSQWRKALAMFRRSAEYSLQLDADCYDSIISAGHSNRCWQLALDYSSYVLSRPSSQAMWQRHARMASGKGSWQAVVVALANIEKASTEPDLKMTGALCDSVRRGGWQETIAVLCHLDSQQVVLDAIVYSSAMSSCRLHGKWQLAGCLLSHCAGYTQCDTILWNTFLASRGAPWPTAVNTLSGMHSAACQADVISYNCLLASCRDSWQQAVACYQDMTHMSLELDVAFSTLIDACTYAGCEEVGKRVLADARQISCTMRFWAMAEMFVLKGLDSALADILQQVKKRMLTTAEISKLWWATASLGLRHHKLLLQLENQSTSQMSQFKLEELVSLAMGACTSEAGPPLLCMLRDEVFFRADAIEMSERDEGMARHEVLQQLVGILWALNFAAPVSSRVFQRFKRLFNTLASCLDATVSFKTARFPSPRVRKLSSLKSPVVLLAMPECLVTAKPSGWEVYGDAKLQMLPYIQTLTGQLPIQNDPDHGFGFLHRLDIPSSGLILSAMTYRSFYDLQLQLASGRLLRDYVVLCHGCVSDRRNEIQARLKVGDMASAGAQGKASHTLLKLSARVSDTQGISLSLVLIRILTGRLHQIRSHVAFIGHPTASDSKYTTAPTFASDMTSCPRNFVHRFSLSFQDQAGCSQRVYMALPHDLCNYLTSLTAVDAKSAHRLETWSRGREQLWDDDSNCA